jgi:acetyl-CoA carboxylase carboxyltransferase component
MNLDQLEKLRKSALQGGGYEQIEKQHNKGKFTARERIERLLDPGTFIETDQFVTHRAQGFGMETARPLTDGVVTGWGKIEGRIVFLYAQDFTILGGSLGESHGLKIARLQEMAYQSGAPVIGINDSGGARIQEGVDSLAAYGEIFYRNMRASGVIPQISVILGPCAGGAVYSPAITDFVLMAEKNAYMFITGPEVIKTVTGEEVDFESLGGAEVHAERSGVAHLTAPDEDAVLLITRWLLSFLPSNNMTPPPFRSPRDRSDRSVDQLNDLVPIDPQKPYDIRNVITEITDEGEFLEIQSEYATNLVVGFARMDGYPVGIVANQPSVYAGVLDINASNKGARFIRFCDAFHIPLITLVDTPGFLPGTDQEYGGVIRHGAKMIFAYAEATVPKVSIILRKAYGGAYIVMSSKHLRGDVNYAWPNAEIAVMGPEGAVQVVYRKELANAEYPEVEKSKLVESYRDELASPLMAAARGYLNDVIRPGESRQRLCAALEMLRDKRAPTTTRKHTNIPL